MKKEARNRYAGLAQEAKDWAAGRKQLRTTLIDKAGGRTVFRASGPELKARQARMEGFKKMRVDLGLSQPAMADALHVGVGTLRNWEYGRREIPDVAWVLAQLLHDLPAVRKRLLAA
jgi:DNA-binding transcriptional regulator YiaG